MAPIAAWCHRGRMSTIDLGQAVERTVLDGHAGMSGAGLERVQLADGRRLVVKRVNPASDLSLGMRGGSVAGEYALWSSGGLERLPQGVEHALLDGWVEGDVTVIVMRDLGDAVLTWDDRLTRERCAWMLQRVTAMHAAYAGDPPDATVSLAATLQLFAPKRIREPAASGNGLFRATLRGWEYFADPELVPGDVASAVLGLLDDMTPLVRVLQLRPATLLHGDLAVVNMAVEDDSLVLLDWAIPLAGPGAVDIARFLVGCGHVLDPTHDEFMALYRQAAGAAYDEVATRLAILSGLTWLGWNKTLDIVESPDPDVRARERASLDWWIREARRTLESGDL